MPLFHCPLLPSSRGSLVPLCVLPLQCYQLRIWGNWYFSHQSWFQLVIHPSPAFCMMYSAYKLSKQGDNIQPCPTLFLILNQSIASCPILTFASWPANRFIRRQVSWSGTPISLRIFQFVVIHTVKSFSIVNEEVEFSGTPLLSLWSNESWQFELWFLCLFETQTVYLEVLGSCTAEA